jgi:DNA-binding transcriptional regulator YiaG
MTINERVKHFRKDVLHISQTEFAVSLGMKQTGVSYMERDGSTVNQGNLSSL